MTIKEYIRSWTLRKDAIDVVDRPVEELSDEYLAAFQRNIDSQMEEGLTFKTVRRASW